jgi:hypothetical protein
MVVGIVGLGGTINVAIEAGCPGGWGVSRIGRDGVKDRGPTVGQVDGN